ncbi:MAG TPA: hypothetical protein VES21_01130, partial [Nocardioidaceae bacterium]|nr:hypothetical protein [Nocardioidaceae bacterium]
MSVARVVAGITAATSLMAVTGVSASAAPVTKLQQSWGTNGRVLSILADGGKVYVAGNFTSVTSADGSSTLPIENVARFDVATKTFDSSWRPNPNGVVTSLALSGGDVYLGGDFSSVAGTPRTDLAAVDATTGAVESWAPKATGGLVQAIGVGGNHVYVGGNFTSLGGGARSYLGRVELSNGQLDTGWTPTPSARVRTLVVAGTRVYVGGDFATVNGSSAGKSIASISTGAS